MKIGYGGFELILEIKDIIGLGIILLSILLQSLSKKIKPWTIIFTWLGKQLNGSVSTQIKKLDADVAAIKDDIARLQKINEKQDCEEHRYRALQRRRNIITAADEIAHGVAHSKEWFKNVLLDVSEYETYCGTHPNFKNQEAVLSIELIKDTFRKRLEKDDFLDNSASSAQ